MKHQKSFTLIELLVVLAIIGLFASIVFINIQGARERARISMGLQFSQSVYNALGAYAVGVWRFEENGLDTCSGTIPYNDICDASGENNHGANYGATWTSEGDTPSRQGYALSFNGMDSYIAIPDSPNLDITNEITLSAWVWINNSVPGGEFIISKRNNIVGDTNKGYFMRSNSGIISVDIYINTGTGILTATAPSALSFKTWHFILGTYDRNSLKLFIDGNEAGDPVLGSGEIKTNDNYLQIGYWHYNQGDMYFFNGLIDEVAIYKNAITTAQIKKLYAEGLERHKNLVQN